MINPKAKKILINIIKLAVAVFLLWCVFSKINFAELKTEFVRMDMWIFSVSLLFMVVIGIIGVKRWLMLLHAQDINIKFYDALRLTYIGLFFNAAMPSLTGGDLIKAFYVARESHKKAAAVVTVFLDRVIGIVALALLSAVTMLFFLDRTEYHEAAVTIYLFVGCVGGGAMVFFSKRIRRLLRFDAIIKKLPLAHIVKEVDDAIILYRDKKRVVLTALVISIVAHSVMIVCIYGFAKSLHVTEVGLVDFFVTMPAILIISSLIPTPGGLGVLEFWFGKYFGFVGMASEKAIALVLLYRFSMYFWSLPGGIFLAMSKDRTSQAEMEKELLANDA